MKKSIVLTGLLIIVIAIFAACSEKSEGEGKEKSGDKQIKIATASTSGAYYPIGGVMASVLSKEIDGYNFTAEATGGSEENARLIDSGKVQIGFFGADSFYNANNGLGSFKDDKIENLATLARIYNNTVHIIAMGNSDIETVSDLKGKTVAIGEPGSGTSNKSEEILTAIGLDIENDIKAEYLGFQDGSDSLVDGVVDAVIISVGIPSGNVQELGASNDIKLVKFTEEEAEKVEEKYPYYSSDVISADAYDEIDEDTLAIVAPNEIGVSKDLDEDLVYEMMEVLFEDSIDEFKDSHSIMKDLELDILPESPVPYHPGAEKFLKEHDLID